MKILKYLLLGLLVLVSFTSIFNTPGVNLFNTFYNLSVQTDKKNLIEWLRILLQYPPGVYLTLNYLLSQFKIDPNISLFDRQSVWLAAKFLIYSFYLLTFFSLLYLRKVNRKIIKISIIDLSIIYFASIPILLSSVALIFFDILSAPFLILSIAFLMQKKLLPAIIFYLISLFFSWSLFVLGPIFLFVFLKERQNFFNKIVLLGSFLLVPLLVILALFASKYHNHYFLGNSVYLNPGSVPKLLSLPFEYVFKRGQMDSLGWAATILSFLVIILGLGNLLKATIFRSLKLKVNSHKIYNVLPFLVIPAALSLSLFWTNSISYLLLGIFLVIYLYFVSKFKNLPITKTSITQGFFVSFLIATLFLPDLGVGSSAIIVLLAIPLYIFNTHKSNFYLLLLVNLFMFINIFSSFGITGIVSVRGEYFVFFRSVFASFLTLFIIWYLNLYLRQKLLSDRIHYLKWLIIILMILLNLSWIPADGSSDHVSWTQYSLASIEQPNPFVAQTLVDQRYPPLSTAILGVFANGWKILIGESEDYAIATKMSVIFFYFLTVFLLIKLSKALTDRTSLSIQDKMLVIFTTFAIVTQTQGFGDLNIYLIPSFFAAIYFLFKKKYFLSGLLMGITISIKWQPIILIPLFGATLFDLRNLFESLKRSLTFALGLVPIPVIVWVLVLINPEGKLAFDRSTDYLLHGAPMLSGQALNLNWLVTYGIHIFTPLAFGSLKDLDYLNRQIPADYAPWIFQGTLFLIVWAIIAIRYWLKERRNIESFLAASLMIFFAHHQLNKSAYEKHLFYVPIFMLFLYLVRPTTGNRYLLILFDIMTVMNLIFFYGFTGTESVSRHFFNFDITILFSLFYLFIFIWVLWKYFKNEIFVR